MTTARLALLAAGFLALAVPAVAQETCGGSIRVERFGREPNGDGGFQVFAMIRNTATRPLGYSAVRPPVPNLRGTTPFGPFTLEPNATNRLWLGMTGMGVTIPDSTLRTALRLACRT